MAVSLRTTHAQFLLAIKGKYGMWMSKELMAASATMLDFQNAKARGDPVGRLNGEEITMIGAWYVWSTKKEYQSVNTKTNGQCKRIAVEMGAIPDIDRESRTTAFVLSGEKRVDPNAKKPPHVVVTDQTVPAYMAAMTKKGSRGGVVLIDAFGGGNSEEAHGFNRKYGNQESSVMDNTKHVLTTASECKMPVFNVTMGSNTTWKSLTDQFPTKCIDIVKPAQPLLMGSPQYVEKTLRLIKDCEVDYLVVMGWDANQCVAAAIFGVEQANKPFVPGLVDHGWNVVTSRNLLGANLDGQLESKWGWPYIGPA